MNVLEMISAFQGEVSFLSDKISLFPWELCEM